MKVVAPILSLLLSTGALAQDQLPTAGQIRQSITDDITAFKIKPQPVAKVVSTAVWTGTDSVRVRL